MSTLQERLAYTIRNRRIAMKMSQEQLAEKIDKTTGSVGQLERGECLPKIETLQAIISALGVDANLLFSDAPITTDDVHELFELALHMDEKKRLLLIEFARLLHNTSL